MRKLFFVGQDCVTAGDADIINEDGTSDVPDIGVGENYRGKAKYVVYDIDDIDESVCEEVLARKKKEPLIIFETDRFIIREMSVGDLQECYALYDSLNGCPYIEPLYEYEEEKAFTEKYIENMYGFFGYGLWLVWDKSTGSLVGRIGIENRSIDGNNCQELGYLVRKEWQGKHVALEVCTQLLKVAKDRFYINELFICTDTKNIPSISLAHRLGFSEYADDINGMNIYRKIL